MGENRDAEPKRWLLPVPGRSRAAEVQALGSPGVVGYFCSASRAARAPHSLRDGLWGVSAQRARLHKWCTGSLLQRGGTAGCVLAHLQIRDWVSLFHTAFGQGAMQFVGAMCGVEVSPPSLSLFSISLVTVALWGLFFADCTLEQRSWHKLLGGGLGQPPALPLLLYEPPHPSTVPTCPNSPYAKLRLGDL